jgi:hypothetical protein
MTRISSLLIASTLAILPLSAFAQQAAKTAEPTTAAAKPEVKTPATGVKTDVHGMNTTTTGHAKVPAKPVEPSKS